MTMVAFYKEGAGIRILPERRYNTWIRIEHKALFAIPYGTNAARATSSNYHGCSRFQLCYPRQ